MKEAAHILGNLVGIAIVAICVLLGLYKDEKVIHPWQDPYDNGK